MLLRFHDAAVYNVLYVYPDTAGVPEGPLHGLRAPAGEDRPGAVLQLLAVVRAARAGVRRDGRRAVTAAAAAAAALIAIVVAVVVVLARRRVSAAMRRQRPPTSASELRGSSAAKVLASLATLAFVVAFNFFLFRVVEGDPVGNLFRGRNLSESSAQSCTQQFGLDGSTGEQFVAYVKQTASLNLGRSYTNNQPVAEEILRKAGPTIALVGRLDAPVGGVRRAGGHRRRVAKTHQDGLLRHLAHDGHLLDAGLLARHAAALRARRQPRPVPGGRHRGPELRRHRARQARRPGPAHGPARPHADARLPRRVRARHALVAARHDARGLPRARAREGAARRRSCATATPSPTRSCRS